MRKITKYRILFFVLALFPFAYYGYAVMLSIACTGGCSQTVQNFLQIVELTYVLFFILFPLPFILSIFNNFFSRYKKILLTIIITYAVVSLLFIFTAKTDYDTLEGRILQAVSCGTLTNEETRNYCKIPSELKRGNYEICDKLKVIPNVTAQDFSGIRFAHLIGRYDPPVNEGELEELITQCKFDADLYISGRR